MLKWAGIMLTREQIGILASNISGNEDLRDMSKRENVAPALFAVGFALSGRFPNVVMWPTSCPRFSNKEEHYRPFLACWTYNKPDETMDNFTKEPIADRDDIFLDWLVERGMTRDDMIKQWTTLPNPQADVPNKVMISDSLPKKGHRKQLQHKTFAEGGENEQSKLDTLAAEDQNESSKD